MAVKTIILVSILMSFFVFNNCSYDLDKRATSSPTFMRLKADQTTQCEFINRDFHKLTGIWHYVLGTFTSKHVPKMRCGHLIVNETTRNGFKSKLDFMATGNTTINVVMTGLYINETIVGIPELDNIVLVRPELRQPFFAQIGICDVDTTLVIEPIFYYGGWMLFTRHIPESMTSLKLRFGTFDEQRGKEQIMTIDTKCTV